MGGQTEGQGSTGKCNAPHVGERPSLVRRHVEFVVEISCCRAPLHRSTTHPPRHAADVELYSSTLLYSAPERSTSLQLYSALHSTSSTSLPQEASCVPELDRLRLRRVFVDLLARRQARDPRFVGPDSSERALFRDWRGALLREGGMRRADGSMDGQKRPSSYVWQRPNSLSCARTA